MFFIACDFKLTDDSKIEHGFAVCSSPDDVVTFIHEDGSPVIETEMWSYQLKHFKPWAHITNE